MLPIISKLPAKLISLAVPTAALLTDVRDIYLVNPSPIVNVLLSAGVKFEPSVTVPAKLPSFELAPITTVSRASTCARYPIPIELAPPSNEEAP